MIAINNITAAEAINKASLDKKYKCLYVSTISHELRTPLNAIKAMLKMIANYVQAEWREYLDTALGACRIEKALINDTIVN